MGQRNLQYGWIAVKRYLKMKSNVHKKQYNIDKFARKFYCEHARLNQLRKDKKAAKRKSRRINNEWKEE